MDTPDAIVARLTALRFSASTWSKFSPSSMAKSAAMHAVLTVASSSSPAAAQSSEAHGAHA
eukprot:7275889-Pyramimonas_sp.AAC.1